MDDSPLDEHGLTQRQRIFLDAYLAGMRVPDAAKVAGTSPAYGWRILREGPGRNYVKLRHKENDLAERLTKSEILNHLAEAILTPADEFDTGSPLAELAEIGIGPDGEETRKTRGPDKLKCIAMYARMTGMEDRTQVEVTASDDLVDAIARLTGARK